MTITSQPDNRTPQNWQLFLQMVREPKTPCLTTKDATKMPSAACYRKIAGTMHSLAADVGEVMS